jgi:TatD DNase family protein
MHSKETSGILEAIMIFDVHCHGYLNGLKHRQSQVRENMRAANVARSIQVGVDWEMSRMALDLARNWGDQTWCSVGFHPTSSQNSPGSSTREWAAQLEALIRDNRDKVVAVGEIGFDYYHLTPGKEPIQKKAQLDFFRAQAELSIGLDLPAVIHSRNAADETILQLKKCGVKRAVIHCFSEDLAFAQELLAWSDDIYFSFSGILTYKNAIGVRNAAANLPLERILVETDAPFLVPQAARDSCKVNEPAFTRHVMDCLKTLRCESGDAVEQTVWDNSNRFFRLD